MPLFFLLKIHVTFQMLDLINFDMAAHRMGEERQNSAIKEERMLLRGIPSIWIDYRFYRP